MLRKYLSILTILILGSMLTVSVFSIMRNDETRRIKENLTDIADNYTNAIQNKLFEHINVLEALVSFYATNKIVNRQQFQIFSSSLLRSHPNIQALYWMPRVTHQQRHAWEVQLDKHYAFKFLTEYNDDNKLTVATERKEYFPIYYTIPHDEKKIGIDISTHSTFQPFLEQARTKQKYVVTGHIDLPCVDKTGFKVIYPVHTISEASQPPILLGFLIGVFTLDMMIENQALYKLPQNMHVRIYDNYDQRLLYSSHDDEKYLANEQIGYKNKKVLHLAEREWTIEFHVDANYVNLARGWQPFTTAIGGFFFMVLTMLYLMSSFRHNATLQNEILERERIAKELIHKEEEFRVFADSAPVMLWMADASSHCLLLNQTWRDFAGTIQEDAFAKTWTSIIHEEDLQHCTDIYKTAFFNKHEDFQMIYRAKRYDGSYRWISETAVARFNAKNQFLGFIGACIDITEQRQAEKAVYENQRQLSTLMNNLPGMAYRFSNDVHRTIEFISRGCLELTGYSSEILMQNPEWIATKIIHPHDRQALLDKIEEAIDTHQTYQHTYRIITHDHEEKWVWEQGQGIFSEHNHLIAVEAFITDISERKQAEEAANHAKKLAEDANIAKSQFLANMSHELRTPLNAIIGYTEMLQEEAEEEMTLQPFSTDLSKIHASAKHLLNLINDILDISKIEAGKMDVYAETFALRPLIDEVVSTILPIVGKRQNSFEIKCEDDLGEIYSDLIKIRQVLLNLLSNAAKFTKAGDIKLHIRRECNEEGDCVIMTIKDTGIGMTPKQQKKLFQIFSQADASTTRKYGGTGLGLAITYQFVKMLQGDIKVESQLGEGSIFTVQLPTHLITAQEKENKSATPLATLKHGKVVTIDDDANTRAILYAYLSRLGYQVISASNGNDGLKLVKEVHPDAVILDIMLNDIDGWMVLSKIKASPELQNIPVIILSMVENKEIGYTLGATDYLIKPVNRKQLMGVLQKYHIGENCYKVLIIEDDATTQTVLGRMLGKLDCEVLRARNGLAALNLLEKEIPDLILLDLMMPEMDGFEFIHHFRQRAEWRNIPIIVLTAKDLTPNEQQQLYGCVTRIFQKGAYHRDQLLDEVRKLLIMVT